MLVQTVACILLSLVALAQAQTAVGLSTNASSVANCKSSCNWNDPTIWDQGFVPGDGDAVTLQNSDVFNLVIDTPINISGFYTQANKGYAANIQILSGGGLYISGGSSLDYTTTLTINTGGFYTVLGGALTSAAVVNIGGNLTANYGSPSFQVQTATQTSLSPVYATVNLIGGTLSAAAISVSSTSNFGGSGYVIGTITSSGTITMGTSTTVGTLYIQGNLKCIDALEDSTIYIKVASATSFDHIIMTGTFTQIGNLYVTPLNSFQPLVFQTFIFANHTAQFGGFETTRASGFFGRFNNNWRVKVDQSYTAVVYGSASNVAISFFVLAVCALVTSL